MVFFLYLPLVFSYLGIKLDMENAKKFNQEINIPLQDFITSYMIKQYELKPVTRKINQKKKIKVAFLLERNIMHSMNQVMYSFFKQLQKNKNKLKDYKIYIFSLEYFELGGGLEKYAKMFQKLGFKYYNLHQELNCKQNPFYNQIEKVIKIRQFIIDKKIDILINSGFIHPTFSFLFTTRTAPMQIYWSHGNCEYDIKGIDKRVSHFLQTCEDKKFNIIQVKTYKKFLIGSKKDQKSAIRIKQIYLNHFGQDTIILGSIGRLIKIDNDEYIKTIAKIMKKNPNTIYLACGSGEQESIKQKLKKYNISENRFIFTGEINPHTYGWVIDFYLAPIDASAGQALDEYRKKIKSYVCIHSKEWYQHILALEQQNKLLKKDNLYKGKYLKRMKAKGYLVKENKFAKTFLDIAHPLNKKDYLKVSLKLLKDKTLQNIILKEYEYIKQMDDQMRDATTYQQFLEVING
jgi:hypothetical protein